MDYIDNPRHPFDGFDEVEDADYREMMPFVNAVENLQADFVGQWLCEHLELTSVIDVGCATGIYLKPYKATGIEVFGVDACTTAGEFLEPSEFERIDLRFPYCPAKRYDLALCTEVGEHLKPRFAERLVDTLWDCSDIIYWSAAVPGQGGTFHYNERPVQFWMDLFWMRHGYSLHPLQDELREFLNNYREEERNHLVSGWLLNNSYLLWRTPELVAAEPWSAPG